MHALPWGIQYNDHLSTAASRVFVVCKRRNVATITVPRPSNQPINAAPSTRGAPVQHALVFLVAVGLRICTLRPPLRRSLHHLASKNEDSALLRGE